MACTGQPAGSPKEEGTECDSSQTSLRAEGSPGSMMWLQVLPLGSLGLVCILTVTSGHFPPGISLLASSQRPEKTCRSPGSIPQLQPHPFLSPRPKGSKGLPEGGGVGKGPGHSLLTPGALGRPLRSPPLPCPLSCFIHIRAFACEGRESSRCPGLVLAAEKPGRLVPTRAGVGWKRQACTTAVTLGTRMVQLPCS